MSSLICNYDDDVIMWCGTERYKKIVIVQESMDENIKKHTFDSESQSDIYRDGRNDKPHRISIRRSKKKREMAIFAIGIDFFRSIVLVFILVLLSDSGNRPIFSWSRLELSNYFFHFFQWSRSVQTSHKFGQSKLPTPFYFQQFNWFIGSVEL